MSSKATFQMSQALLVEQTVIKVAVLKYVHEKCNKILYSAVYVNTQMSQSVESLKQQWCHHCGPAAQVTLDLLCTNSVINKRKDNDV